MNIKKVLKTQMVAIQRRVFIAQGQYPNTVFKNRNKRRTYYKKNAAGSQGHIIALGTTAADEMEPAAQSSQKRKSERTRMPLKEVLTQ